MEVRHERRRQFLHQSRLLRLAAQVRTSGIWGSSRLCSGKYACLERYAAGIAELRAKCICYGIGDAFSIHPPARPALIGNRSLIVPVQKELRR